MVSDMASITLKDLPDDLHAQLKSEAEANLRSINQEAIIRIQRSFDVQDQFSTLAVNKLIEEAMASGPAQPFTEKQLASRFEQVRQKTRARLNAEKRAA
jgi:plasmid stability protein